MQTEVVRIVVDALNDSTNGVNAQLAALDSANLLESGDTVPDDVTIYDETRDGWVARGSLPSKQADGALSFPCIAVSVAAPIAWDLNRQTASTGAKVQAADVTIAIEWYTKSAMTPALQRAMSTTMRAVRGALMLLHDPAITATRVRNNVRIIAARGVSQDARAQSLEDPLLRATLTVSYHMHESTP